MQYNAKAALLMISIASIVLTLVVGQMAPVLAQSVPTSSNLVKRDYSYTDDQHLTARFGNSRVCGDHMCAPGEWTKLQESLNHAQISHTVNKTTATSLPPTVPITPPTTPTNSTITVHSNSTTTVTPATVPTPPTVPSSVCVAVKAALGNSTVSAGTVAKIMSDLGCS
jgi:hypothetical protein